MKNENYFQVYDQNGLVIYTNQNDKPLIAPFPIGKLYDFIVANYDECHVTMYLDNNWDEVCLDYWNKVISVSEGFKSQNREQQTRRVA